MTKGEETGCIYIVNTKVRDLIDEVNKNNEKDGKINKSIFKDLTKNNNKIIEITSELRNIIGKKFNYSNINFLIGTGTSIDAGAKSIDCRDDKIKTPLENSRNKQIKNYRKQITDKNVEELLNDLIQIKLYLNLMNKEVEHKEVEKLIEEIQSNFLEESVLNINYNFAILDSHKIFIKKILENNNSGLPINIFTLNYDMLFELVMDNMEITYVNGFNGFQKRKFKPSLFNNQETIKQRINLIKLHGSLSWRENLQLSPYGIEETQVEMKDNKIILKTAKELIIYPSKLKEKLSFGIPYSDLFRVMIEKMNNLNSVLFIIGYSFSDEHINNIITNSLSNPQLDIVIFSYRSIEEAENEYLKKLIEVAKTDSRITILFGEYLAEFKFICKYILPFSNDYNDENERILLSLKQLQGNRNGKN